MNGEMLLAAADVIAVEYCRKTNKILPEQSENHPIRRFHFLDGRETDNFEKWVKWVNDDGIRKMIFYPNMVKILERRKEIGFLHAFVVIQPVFHANGEMSFWQNMWEYDKEAKRWNIDATERAWENGPKELISFPPKDEAQAFLASLHNMMLLCDEIKTPAWKKVFERSQAMLTDADYDLEGENTPKYFHRYVGVLPKGNLRLFASAANAFVFGAMGTWNDEPAAMAAEIGKQEEYDKASSDLLFGCVANLTYAVNHW